MHLLGFRSPVIQSRLPLLPANKLRKAAGRGVVRPEDIVVRLFPLIIVAVREMY